MNTSDKSNFENSQQNQSENAGSGSGYGSNQLSGQEENELDNQDDADNISTGDYTGSESSSTLFRGSNMVVDETDNEDESQAAGSDDDELGNCWERSFL
ncbi:MAG TPA: hypothetical protein VGB44_05105 [Flavobacterium sp.]|jgi:hypothetical protein